MRTTILLSTLLLLGGPLRAQDSQITVADTGSKLPSPRKKTPPTAYYVQHNMFDIDYTGIFNDVVFIVQDKDNQNRPYVPACITSQPNPTGSNPVKLTGTWHLTLNDNVELSWDSSKQQIKIAFDHERMTVRAFGGDQQVVLGHPLTSAHLNTPNTQYNADPNTRYLELDIHYCPQDQNGAANCKDPKTGTDPCQ